MLLMLMNSIILTIGRHDTLRPLARLFADSMILNNVVVNLELICYD